MYHLTNIILLSLVQNFKDIDLYILKGIYENRILSLDSTFVFITNTAAVIAFGVPAILLVIAYINKNTVLRSNALSILLTVALSAILANILKYTIDLPRPFDIYPFILKLTSGGSPTFPSGHTADAFAFAVAAALVFPKWFVIFPCFIWAVLVGYSRMCLGVHFPSDVLAGALVGAACAYSYQQVRKRKQVSIE